MQFKKLAILTILFLSLSGCSNQKYQNHRFNEERFTEEKSVIVFQMGLRGFTSDLWIRAIKFANEDGSEFPIYNEKGNYTHIYSVHRSMFSSKLVVMLVDPGYYSLNNIVQELGDAVYYSNPHIPPVSFTDNGTFVLPFGGFYAPKGKVTYIGKIFFDFSAGFYLEVQDDEQGARKALKKKYPALEEQLERGFFLQSFSEQKFQR